MEESRSLDDLPSNNVSSPDSPSRPGRPSSAPSSRKSSSSDVLAPEVRRSSGERHGNKKSLLAQISRKLSGDHERSAVSRTKSTELFEAVKSSSAEEILDIIRHAEVDVNFKSADHSSWTSLHRAAYLNKADTVKVLLRRDDINVNLTSRDGWSPFWLACCNGSLGCVKVLLRDYRVDLNLPDSRGATPLWIAASKGLMEVVELIVASGRPFSTKSVTTGALVIDMGTPQHVARSQGFEEVARLLENYEAHPDAVRETIREKIGFKGPQSAELFAAVVYLSDGYLELLEPSQVRNKNILRYFAIAKQLPMDLQMVLCNRTFGQRGGFIPVSEVNDALYSVKSALQHNEKGKKGDRSSCRLM